METKKVRMKKSFLYWLTLLAVVAIINGCDSDDDDELWGNWVELGAFEGLPRTDAVVFVIGDYAYVGTGYNGEEDERYRDFWRYDPQYDTWVEVAPLPDEAPARNGAVAFAAAGKGYVGTGFDDDENKLNDFWEFDPNDGAKGSWTRIADFPGSGRYGAVAFAINDKGYVGTGYDGNRLKDFYEYDPSTGQWTQKKSVRGSKRRDAVAFVINGEGYIFTGVDNSDYVTDAWKYNPETDVWTELRKITSGTNDDESYDDDYSIVGSNGVAFTLNGYAYITTGGPGYAGNRTWEYDPETDFWEEKSNFEGSSRTDAVAFTINNQAFVATGNSSGYYFDDVWTFYPDEEQDDND